MKYLKSLRSPAHHKQGPAHRGAASETEALPTTGGAPPTVDWPPILRLRPLSSALSGSAPGGPAPGGSSPLALSHCGAAQTTALPPGMGRGGWSFLPWTQGAPPRTPSAPWVSCLQTLGCIAGILYGEILPKHSHGSVFTRPAPRFPPARRDRGAFESKPPPGQRPSGGVSVRGKQTGKARNQESLGVFMRLLGPVT